VPVNEEIHMPHASKLGSSGQLSWFNPLTQRVYIPFQTIINEGITKEQDFEVNKKENLSTESSNQRMGKFRRD